MSSKNIFKCPQLTKVLHGRQNGHHAYGVTRWSKRDPVPVLNSLIWIKYYDVRYLLLCFLNKHGGLFLIFLTFSTPETTTQSPSAQQQLSGTLAKEMWPISTIITADESTLSYFISSTSLAPLSKSEKLTSDAIAKKAQPTHKTKSGTKYFYMKQQPCWWIFRLIS